MLLSEEEEPPLSDDPLLSDEPPLSEEPLLSDELPLSDDADAVEEPLAPLLADSAGLSPDLSLDASGFLALPDFA